MNTYQYIINPVTNRKVLINTQIGTRILQKYLLQVGGTNPHTGKEWSSYTCKGLTRNKCNSANNKKRCNWVKSNSKRKGHCKKQQHSSRKRAKRNWKNLKSKITPIYKILASAKKVLEDDEIVEYNEEYNVVVLAKEYLQYLDQDDYIYYNRILEKVGLEMYPENIYMHDDETNFTLEVMFIVEPISDDDVRYQ